MEFDKSRVYTALNADELKVGSKVILADSLGYLKECIHYNNDVVTLVAVKSEKFDNRFFDGKASWNLAYLVEESGNLKWTDLRIGDVITDGTKVSMVTEIDKKEDTNCHICAGDGWWFDAKDLANWEKVEE